MLFRSVPPQAPVLPQAPILPRAPIPSQAPVLPQAPILPQAPVLPQDPVYPQLSLNQFTPTINPTSHLHMPATPPLRRSPHLKALRDASLPDSSLLASQSSHLPSSDIDPRISNFLAEFSAVCDTHCLLPVSLCDSSPSLTVSEALAALATGNTEPLLDEDDDPLWAKALTSPEREYWIAGARDELKSLSDLNIFVLVPRTEVPSSQRPLKGKLVCKRKCDDAGNVARYKVHYVAKGFAQRYLIDYNETTAPMARLKSFQSLLHIAAVLDWDVQHVDIKTTFLHSVLPDSKTIFLEQPPGFKVAGKED